jgi:2-oxoglutarate dehydrogenase E1 component
MTKNPVQQIVEYVTSGNADCSLVSEKLQKEFNVLKLIDGYRTRGHLFTKTNPVRDRRTSSPTLDIENFGLSTADLSTVFDLHKQLE